MSSLPSEASSHTTVAAAASTAASPLPTADVSAASWESPPWQSDNSALLCSHSGSICSPTTQPQPYAATHLQSNLSPPQWHGAQQMQPQQPQQTLSVSSPAGAFQSLPPMHPAANSLYNLASSHFGVSVSGATQLVQTLSAAAGPPSPQDQRAAAERGGSWLQDPASGTWSLWASSPASSFGSQQTMQMQPSSLTQRSFEQQQQQQAQLTGVAEMRDQLSQSTMQLDPNAFPDNTLSNPAYNTHSISQLQGTQLQEASEQFFAHPMQQMQTQQQTQQHSSCNQELSSFQSQNQLQFDRGYEYSSTAQQIGRCFPEPQQQPPQQQQFLQPQQPLYQQSFSNFPQQTFSGGSFSSGGDNTGDDGTQSIDPSVPHASLAPSYSSAFGRRNPLVRAPSFGNGTRAQMGSAQAFPLRGPSPQHPGSTISHPPLPWQQHPSPIASPSGQGTVLVLTLIHPKYSDEPHRAHLIQLMRPKLSNGHGHEELKQFDPGHMDDHASGIIEVPVPSVDEVATLFRKHGRLLKIIVSFKAGLSRSLVQVRRGEQEARLRADYSAL